MKLFEKVRDLNDAPGSVGRDTMIQIVIVTMAFLMIVRAWPCNLVKTHTYSRQGAVGALGEGVLSGDVFTAADKKLQTVYFQKNHIYRITLYMDCQTAGDRETKAQTVMFRLYNDAFSCIYEEEVTCGDIESNGYLRAEPDLDVEEGKAYYYEILVPQDCKAQVTLPVADRGALSQAENSTLFIDGIYNDAVCLIADFDYTKSLSLIGIILYDLLILAAAVCVYLLACILIVLYDEKLSRYGSKPAEYARFGVSVAGILAALGLFVFSVVQNRFGGEIWDRLCFTAGILAALAWFLGALWLPVKYPRPQKVPDSRRPAASQRSLIWRNYIQTVSFGLLFYALCQYVNADRNYYHYTNTRWMLIFLAIALLMNYNEKQFVNKLNGIWLLLGVIGTVVYCRGARGDESERLLARLTCGVVVSWGLLVITILLQFVRRRDNLVPLFVQYVKKNRQQVVYIALWVLFCVLMYAYRYEKVWVFTATLPFLALFFVRNTEAFWCRFLKNFTNGILLSFGLVTLFCLAHRPHHYWMLYRYNGIFHTVACTGMYLAVVFGAAMAKLYGKLKNRKSMLVRCRSEYFVTACVAGYILLTMSRTAFLAVAVTALCIIAVTAVTYRKGVRRVLAEAGVLIAVCAVSFPMVFTAVRMVPAVVGDPVRYEIEFQDRSFMIYEGDPIDSDKYMTVRRFFSVLFGRFQTETGEAESLRPREDVLLAYAGQDLAGVYIRGMDASAVDMRAAEDAGDDGGGEDKSDISNGRFAIFRAYIEETGLKGHSGMGPEKEDGTEYAHAHNSYLQVAYNFGMIAGGLFLILCAMTLWRSIRLFYRRGSRFGIFLVPFALVVVFGLMSLTEWAFHPCIPAGFGFLMMQTVLARMKAA